MNTQEINELITAYVDGELSEMEERALMEKARHDKQIYQAIEAERRFKETLRSRLHRKQAPESLKKNIMELLSSEHNKQPQSSNSGTDNRNIKTDYPSPNRNRFLLSLAAVVAVGLLIMLALRFTGGTSNSSQQGSIAENAANMQQVEEVSQLHYARHSGQQLPESFEAASVGQAEDQLRQRYNLDIVVPELRGAQFAGVSYTDFYDGFHAPLLTYKVDNSSGTDDFIYIFAFQNEDLAGHRGLNQNAKAREAIVAHDDVFIHRVENHDVVSWQWHDVWYTAVSQHDGEIVAAMLPH